MKRRDFLKTGGIAGTAGLILDGCGKPQQLIPLLVAEDRFVPGEEGWVRTLCQQCSAGMRHHRSRDAGRVDSHDRRPAEARQGGAGEEDRGQPRTPDQHGRHLRARPGRRAGALSPRSHSDAAEAVGPARLGTVSADQLERGAATARDAAAAAAGDAAGDRHPHRPQESRHDGHHRRTVCGGPRHAEPRRPTTRSIRRRFARRWSSSPACRGCPPWISRTRTFCCRSTRICSRRSCRPCATSTRTARCVRDVPGIRGTFVHAEPRLSQTAACADEWLPIKPGTEGLLALAIAHVIVNEKLYDAEFVGQSTGGFAEWSASLGDYAPEKIAAQIDVPAASIQRVAREFATRRPSVAIGDSRDVASLTAIYALNALVGAYGRPGGILFGADEASGPVPAAGARPPASGAKPGAGRRSPKPTFTALIGAMGGKPDEGAALARHEPALHAAGRRTIALGARATCRSSRASRPSSTNRLSMADLILPSHTTLERWVDDVPEPGVGFRGSDNRPAGRRAAMGYARPR